MASPAEVLKQILLDLGQVTTPDLSPPPGGATPVVFVSGMPDEYDLAVCLYDVVGRIFGRRMSGKTLLHPGVRLIFRSLTFAGYDTLQVMVNALENYKIQPGGSLPVPTINSLKYPVQSVYRDTPIVPLGEETGKQRQMWSVNFRVAFSDTLATLG